MAVSSALKRLVASPPGWSVPAAWTQRTSRLGIFASLSFNSASIWRARSLRPASCMLELASATTTAMLESDFRSSFFRLGLASARSRHPRLKARKTTPLRLFRKAESAIAATQRTAQAASSSGEKKGKNSTDQFMRRVLLFVCDYINPPLTGNRLKAEKLIDSRLLEQLNPRPNGRGLL